MSNNLIASQNPKNRNVKVFKLNSTIPTLKQIIRICSHFPDTLTAAAVSLGFLPPLVFWIVGWCTARILSTVEWLIFNQDAICLEERPSPKREMMVVRLASEIFFML